MAGQHVMRHQDGLWNAMWSDLFIETTYMRYGHGPSGIIGSTLNESTMAIWALSQSACAQVRHEIEAMKTHGNHQHVTYHNEERHLRMIIPPIIPIGKRLRKRLKLALMFSTSTSTQQLVL